MPGPQIRSLSAASRDRSQYGSTRPARGLTVRRADAYPPAFRILVSFFISMSRFSLEMWSVNSTPFR